MNKFSSFFRFGAVAVAALLISACSSQTSCPVLKKSAKASTCAATGFSMAGKTTYKWVLPENGIRESDLHNNAFWRSEARAAIDADLQKKGYRKVASGKADFLVSASGMKRQDGTIVIASGATAYKSAPGLCKSVCPMKSIAEGQGCASVEIINPSTKLIVWRSCVQATIEDKLTAAQREKKIKSLAASALKDLPAAK